MSNLKTKQLLINAANLYQKKKMSFSRESISRKINEIKYLAAQRNVPKLSLRKQIISLENQLDSVMELEKSLLSGEKKESSLVMALKKENHLLKKRLALLNDKELQKKVNKISHVLGDSFAKREISVDVLLSEKTMEEQKKEEEPAPEPVSSDGSIKILMLGHRLEALKKELEIKKHTDGRDEKKIQQIERRIAEVEAILDKYSFSKSAQEMEGEVRHKIFLGKPLMPKEEIYFLQGDLPLPPPPRMVKK